MIIAAEKQTSMLKTAANVNFWGKRLRAKKLEICDELSKEHYGSAKHSSEICDWLENNRPVKPAAAQREKRQAVEDTRPVAAGQLNSSVESWEVLPGRRFILTSIQNNTFPHANFWQTLQEAANVGYQNDEIMTPPSVKVPEFVVLYVNPDNDHYGIAINRDIFKPEMLELQPREIWIMEYAFSFEEKEIVK